MVQRVPHRRPVPIDQVTVGSHDDVVEVGVAVNEAGHLQPQLLSLNIDVYAARSTTAPWPDARRAPRQGGIDPAVHQLDRILRGQLQTFWTKPAG